MGNKINRRNFIKTSGAITLGAYLYSTFGFTPEDEKPNLLFILTDQQRTDTLAVYGNDKIAVPNLNKLADDSIVFKNCYVTQPVCTASRSTLLTGLYPHSNGCTANNLPLSKNTLCLPEMILNVDPDYSTAYFGKWHLGDEIFPQHGFKEWAGIDDDYSKYYSVGKDKSARSAYYYWLIDKGYTPEEKAGTFSRDFVTKLPYKHSKTKFIADRAIDFIQRNRKNPFILYLGIFEPHSPFNGPFDNLYDTGDVSLPDNFNAPLEDNEPLRNRLLREDFIKNGTKGYDLQSDENWKEMISNYWGLVNQVDKSVGSVLDKLEELGLKENTIVVFTSDHGDMMGSHKMALKTVMYEEASKVPFMIRFPKKFREQKIVTNPICNIDVVPTIMDMLGKKPETFKQLQGHSLIPFLTGDTLKEEYVFYEWNPNTLRPISKRLPLSIDSISEGERDVLANQHIRAIVSPDKWKMCLSDKDLNQLYNLNEDPGETQNLFYDPKYLDIVNNMKTQLYRRQKETKDIVQFIN